MKMRQLYIVSLVVLLTATQVLFQNVAVADLADHMIPRVENNVRVNHARELVGNLSKEPIKYSYKKLHSKIFKTVKSYMPKLKPKQAAKFTAALIKESQRRKLDPVFVMAVIRTESGFDAKAVGSVGEIGLMQIRPSTAEWIAKRYDIKWKGKDALFDPEYNVKIGVAYMSWLRGNFDKAPQKYVNAYNLGPSALQRGGNKLAKKHGYKKNVIKNYKEIYASLNKGV